MPIAPIMVRSRMARSSLYVQIRTSTSGCVCISHGMLALDSVDREERSRQHYPCDAGPAIRQEFSDQETNSK